MSIVTLITSWIASALIGGGLVLFSLRKIIQGKVKSHFDKKLVEVKHDLQLVVKNVEHDYQRRIHDFTLFSSKKHEVYMNVYKMVCNLEAKLQLSTEYMNKFYNLVRFSDNFVDIREYLIKEDVPELRVRELEDIYKKDKILGIKEFEKMMDFHELLKSDEIRVETYEEVVVSELYIKEEVSKKVHEMIEISRKLIYYFNKEKELINGFGSGDLIDKYRKENKQRKKDLTQKREEIKKLMENELNVN
ncbi:hypothetical protein [Terribacillus saccharophilus]|uniref:Uncharacterized protein n=1 Tax=Terribacillus saccharophilus TaxID=361277 RepID=A0ABX4H0C8_9BACI|nr:hypothetical protein [Terribacillus saccharophilus]PAD35957.1 hypothetical protein CHH56_05900 [Terribacillus saccharophilus]PAD96993.1 hypothetical protein CHH50_06410 [Terribacillus saccharophilus]PAE00569.1 hypothetical protein CHH48_07315 [Terribacillus saccharophilus]